MEQTIESKTASTLLQRPQEIMIGEKKYMVNPPTIATLVLVSEAISQLPHLKLDEEDIVTESLRVAKDCKALGDIAAILILGAKGCRCKMVKEIRKTRHRRLFGILPDKETEEEVTKVVDCKAELSNEIMETMTPSDFYILLSDLLKSMQLNDFFGVTTFLCEINLTKQTRVD